MKKILLILGLFAFLFACSDDVGAQDREADGGTMRKGDTYIKYTGVAADSLTTNHGIPTVP